MTGPLYVDPSATLRAASIARDQSGTIMEYLDAVDRDVEDLLATWKGDAAKAYSESWDDLLVLLRLMAADLDGLGEHVSDSTWAFVRASSSR